jgi:hypothetical protein
MRVDGLYSLFPHCLGVFRDQRALCFCLLSFFSFFNTSLILIILPLRFPLIGSARTRLSRLEDLATAVTRSTKQFTGAALSGIVIRFSAQMKREALGAAKAIVM